MLDPGRGEGGDAAWCPGIYRGTVTYAENYACPGEGTCRVPVDFKAQTEVVARFRFEVR
jgi:hypothetical protein